LLIIDTRSKDKVAKGHVAGSLHIENGKLLSSWGRLLGRLWTANRNDNRWKPYRRYTP